MPRGRPKGYKVIPRERPPRELTYVIYIRTWHDEPLYTGLTQQQQRDEIAIYVKRWGGRVIAEYVEEAPARYVDDRPVWREACAFQRVTGSKLLVVTLDRFTLSSAHLAGFLNDGRSSLILTSTCVDYPDPNPNVVLHCLAAGVEEIDRYYRDLQARKVIA